MWGAPPPPPGGMMNYGMPGQAAIPQPHQPQQAQQAQQQQKHDIFVGNLAFTTTEEQLHQAFSEIGRVLKVRMVTDLETGKPRGFAFIEFEDPQAALSAIRNMNDYELNGRRIRVNFSNSSHLEALAGKLGMDLSSQQNQQSQSQSSASGGDKSSSKNKSGNATDSGTQSVADALKTMTKGEMYDVIAKLKEISERDADEARRLLSGHPQLPEAILHLMSKLDMIKSPLSTEGYASSEVPGAPPPPAGVVPPPPPPPGAAGAPPPGDPRAAMAAGGAMPPLADPRAAAMAPGDPRAMAAAGVVPPPPPAADPRMAQAGVPPPPPPGSQPPPQQPPPPPMQYGAPPPPPPGAAAGGIPPPPPGAQPQAPITSKINPELVQQVMSLPPEAIAQLPPDKQQSILALRQQIERGM
mmetsp:Transcript_5614/g.7991  ORF Transcript_5614/g.7991 Transcript_5614/m.7991 type:complete len:411 (-) Transcript_5614:208-1440(-)